MQSFPPQNRGSALGVYTAFVDLSLGISGPVAGVIVSELGYSPILLFAAVIAGSGLTVSFLLYRKHSKYPAIGGEIRESLRFPRQNTALNAFTAPCKIAKAGSNFQAQTSSKRIPNCHERIRLIDRYPSLFAPPFTPRRFYFNNSLRTCEKIRKRRARARKAVWQGAREGASPQRAVTERATRPDGLSCSRPQGCVSFWLGLRCSGGTADRRETACRRQPAGRCKASATPLRVLPPPSRLGQAKNPAATRHFVIFSQVLSVERHCYEHLNARLWNHRKRIGKN